jgi:alkane 1-monooxygenase
MKDGSRYRFALAWLLPLLVGLAAWQSPLLAWAAMAGYQLAMALAERVPALQHSPAPARQTGWHRACVRFHVPLQMGLLGLGLWLAGAPGFDAGDAVLLGIAVGGVTGSQGITFAHELGHSRSRGDRALAWLLMASVSYAHFMVEHYRGHHPRAATFDDPATARRGESLWRFLPRTLRGGLASAWRLEARQLRQRGRS